MTVEVAWRRPRLGRLDHEHIAQTLRDRPGEWARVERPYQYAAAKKYAYRICIGGIKAFSPAGDFEAVHRQDQGRYYVYARYLGDGGFND